MIRAPRRLAAAMSILALSVSFAEMAWASTCGPAMEMPATSPGRDGTGGPECPHVREAGRRSGATEDGSHCPFSSPDAARLCSGIASAPAPAITLADAPDVTTAAETSPPPMGRYLLARPFFRPPRA